MAVGLNVAAHGWTGQGEELERIVGVFRDVADRLVRQHGASLTYLVHHDAELAIAQKLRRAVPSLCVAKARPDRLLYHYSRQDLVISMMLHSAILAVAAGTPVLGVAYDDKSRAFFDDLGASERCFDERTVSADQLLLAALPVLGSRPRDEFKARVDAFRRATSALVDQIKSLCR